MVIINLPQSDMVQAVIASHFGRRQNKLGQTEYVTPTGSFSIFQVGPGIRNWSLVGDVPEAFITLLEEAKARNAYNQKLNRIEQEKHERLDHMEMGYNDEQLDELAGSTSGIVTPQNPA